MSAITHPLLFMPVHLQRGAAVAAAPLGQQRVLVVAQDYLFRVGGGRRFGGDVLGPRCVQRLNGRGQQLTVTHHDKLTGLRGEGKELQPLIMNMPYIQNNLPKQTRVTLSARMASVLSNPLADRSLAALERRSA